ncbi:MULTISPECIES: hypothetical protein [Peribacillus]|uniref:hypothetical protein n=1 Tax=Peribacillus TaxID=2675229 RepID=UPI001F4DA535|nr:MULTISPECIES: hypothetical protein [unclassified Peribacillus]MCK1985439.1 hypothetical protein [Peribacillus sp. Aquil_B1]MCK2007827.1 hypothetical protein [Peribacillus sp. Aquil_B8]
MDEERMCAVRRTFFCVGPIISTTSISFNDAPSENVFLPDAVFIKSVNSKIHIGGKRGNYRQNNGKYFTN